MKLRIYSLLMSVAKVVLSIAGFLVTGPALRLFNWAHAKATKENLRTCNTRAAQDVVTH